MQSLVNQLNSELDDSILNDFRVVSEAGRLVFTNPYDFEILCHLLTLVSSE